MLIPKKNYSKNSVAINTPANILNPETYRVDLSKSNIKQQIIISIQQKIILTAGSLMVLTGKPKARKTTFLHAFLAAGLLRNNIWKIKVSLTEEQPEICLIDTEQSLFDLFASLNRLAGIVNEDLKDIKNFSVYTARAGDVENICKLVETILNNNPKIGLIAIDGLLDLVNDINDVRESKAAITFIKQICDKYNVAVIGIIHQNKGTNFSLGHLGAFASRFAQSEFSIVKNEEDNTSTLEGIFLRSADYIEPITIEYDAARGVYDTIGNSAPIVFDNIIFIKAIFNGKVALSYKDLINLACQATGKSRYEVEKKIIPSWYANLLIEKVGNFIQLTQLPNKTFTFTK